MTTERDVLDALWARCAVATNGTTRRHVLAEQVRNAPTSCTAIADAISVDTWASGHHALHGYEVKVTRSDYLRELRDPHKHEIWARHCQRWWIVAPPGVVRDDLLPGWGLLTLTATGLRQTVPATHRPDPEPLTPAMVAGLVRAAQQTAEHHLRHHHGRMNP